MDLAGSTVLVTGASSGIGAALAPQLAARGATVGIVARRGRSARGGARGVPGALPRLRDVGGRPRPTSTPRRRVAHEAVEQFGHVDVLVNNAAIGKRKLVQTLTPDDLDTTMRTNFTSPDPHGDDAAAPHDRARLRAHRQRVEHGWTARHRARGRLLRVEVRAVRLERVGPHRPATAPA